MSRAKTSALLTHGLPGDLELERWVLGSVLRDCRNTWPVVADLLVPADFELARHQLIAETIASMVQAGEAVDTATVGRNLHADGLLSEVGGLAELIGLTDGMPEIVNLDAYCKRVKELSSLRAAVFTLAAAQERLSQPGAGVDAIRDIQALVAALNTGEDERHSGFRSIKEIIGDSEDGGARGFLAPASEEIGLPWPIQAITEVAGGFRAGNVTVIAAGTGKGKTTMATQVALHVARLGCGVAILSLEMTDREVARKIVAQAGAICMSDWINGQQTEGERRDTQRAAVEAAQLPIFIDDRNEVTPAMLEASVIRLAAECAKADIELRMVIVDYLQLCESGIVGNKQATREQHVAEISRALKKMAKRQRVHVIALSQLNDEGKLRESRRIGQDATTEIHLEDKGQGQYHVAMKKARFSARQKVELYFDGRTGLFRELVND